MEKEKYTVIFFIAKVGETIGQLFMAKAKDMLGHINVKELESGISALKYHGQLTLEQRGKFNEFCDDYNLDCIYLVYDTELEDKVSEICIATYE